MDPQTFDYIVLGGGPAGTSAAQVFATFKKSVALIEKSERLGGAGLNTGTIPSKALRESALIISGARSRQLLGVDFSIRTSTRLGDFMHHERRVSAAESDQVRSRLLEGRVSLFCGDAHFDDAQTVRVTKADGTELAVRGSKIVVATGSSPVRPPEFPFEHPRVHDSNEILEITHLPRVLAVIGAGVIGAEYASTFAALGVTVHLVDGRESLLPFLDQEVSTRLQSAMHAGGIQFHWKEKVLQCLANDTDQVLLRLTSGAELAVTDVLVAAGRSSNTGTLNLAAAGLTPGERGLLKVNEHYQTEVPNIYAAGDVIGAPALAGTSMEQARVAALHALGLPDKATTHLLPTGIYTIPEASHVGETEQSLQKQGVPYLVGRADYLQSPRGRLIGDETGFLKLLFRQDDLRLVGVHVLGEQATELVHIGLVAMHSNASLQLFSRICFNYPTLGDLYKYAAYDAILKRLGAAPP